MLTFNSDILENMTKLQHLSFGGCEKLEELPSHITNQASLGELHLYETSLRELPINISELSKLRVMEIGSPLLISLPTSLGNLSSLTKLRISCCPKLESLPDSLGRLNLLEHLSLNSSGVKSLPKSLCSLKKISLQATKVSKISISEDCCPGLETFEIRRDHHLREIEALPTTVKDIELWACEKLKNIRGIGGLLNLQKLKIGTCPALDEFPSFADLASLKEFVLEDCYKVEKIEGVKHCRSLEKLRAHSRWEVPGIESFEHVGKLGWLELRTCKRSAVEPCIQTLQKWPGDIIICTRAVSDAASLANLFTFPNLSIVDSFANLKLTPSLICLQHPFNAVMVCLVINCVSSYDNLHKLSIQSDDGREYETWVEEGKWVWIGVFTQRSARLTSNKYKIRFHGWHKDDEAEKGLLAMGEEKSVVEAFPALLALLGSN